MKANTIKSANRSRTAIAVAGIVLAVAALVAIAIAYERLHALWLEQCVITDAATQVSITDGKMVRSDVIAYEFGLKNGANLALIDFETKRRDILKKIPNIRNITISRHLPNRVEITVEERIPVVRLGIRGQKRDDGRVADADGVVFISSSGTQMLPVIREKSSPGTGKGQQLSGPALGALVLLTTCREKFPELNAIEADISKPDSITVVLGNDYSLAIVDWPGRENPSEATNPALVKQLKELSHAYTERVDNSIRVWNATIPGKVAGNTMKKIL